MNLTDALTVHARTRPEHPAIEDGARTATYRQLETLVNAAAANLRRAGIGVGDIVAVRLPDGIEHLVVHYALVRAGAIVITLSGGLPKAELDRSIAGVAIKAVIGGGPAGIDGASHLGLTEIWPKTAHPFRSIDLADDAPVTLNQSSGTTGLPKTLLRTNAQTMDRVRRHMRSLGWRADDRLLLIIGMSFDLGRTMILGMLQVGATVVVNRARSAAELAAAIVEKRITVLYITPMHMRLLLGCAGGDGPLFPGLRALYVGTARVARDQRLAARQRLTPNIVETFGSTECGLLATLPPADQDRHPEAVGRLVEGVEAEIVDADDRALPPGQDGVLRFRVAEMPTGYMNDPEASALAFRHGWFYPGDIAALNEAGHLFFKGRADDVINNAGAKFYPIEVENALLAHPEIDEAAVFGWPNERVGETVLAVLAARRQLSKAEVTRFCGERLAAYKVPHVVVFMPELPKNAMGKTLKAELKQQVIRALEQAKA